jgi:hypothetical protein
MCHQDEREARLRAFQQQYWLEVKQAAARNKAQVSKAGGSHTHDQSGTKRGGKDGLLQSCKACHV